ncbi:A24 family peptidase [Geodermatophilus sp. YIM 151500]|uniref:prepilin peptidase n=1 Tax=Geodermatophilus sp. YIM 151500 TaxID=2984531 RepID=UPI0021E37953|nr:A24 family peptidase [Geodermatophilus sp. YIM 151500]MCV2489997.1 A24 family peptidase [Geodermatophilus sp. YIM 151500]
MTVLVAVCALLGLVVGAAANRAAGAFPWAGTAAAGEQPAAGGATGSGVRVASPTRVAVRRPLLEVATAALFALTALRLGPAADLPAFLALAGTGVLLTVIDLRHRLLPNRVVGPAFAAGALLLAAAALVTGEWAVLGRAAAGAAVLFAGYLGLALLSPGGLGMGDVKLAGLLGLHLGWLGWTALAAGAVLGFVVQAALALVLLAVRRIGLRGELPFGPAMLVGAALAVWGAVPAG